MKANHGSRQPIPVIKDAIGEAFAAVRDAIERIEQERDISAWSPAQTYAYTRAA